ncbi:hypothetical protein NKH10_09800 [Mesorhizobium sp. M1340]|uniref:hypothetical protein n=1 Tax=unclassified Mesorhizobium TaxID=325217 RepID=UPI003335AC56
MLSVGFILVVQLTYAAALRATAAQGHRVTSFIAVGCRKPWKLAEAPQLRHPWAKQERSSVAKTLGSMP